MSAALPNDDSRYLMDIWIVREPCGCIGQVWSAAEDYRKESGDHAAEAIRQGRTPMLIKFRDYYAEGFGHKCDRKPAEQMEITT